MAKISSIEDFMIELHVKLDNIRQNGRTSNKTGSSESKEIDISELKVLGLPAESEADIEKLEENLKNEEYKKKLVSNFIRFLVTIFNHCLFSNVDY